MAPGGEVVSANAGAASPTWTYWNGGSDELAAMACPVADRCYRATNDAAGAGTAWNNVDWPSDFTSTDFGWIGVDAGSGPLTAMVCPSTALCLVADDHGDLVIGKAAPVNVARPTIAGDPTAGQLLTEAQGGWINSPTLFGYQWQRCDGLEHDCVLIAGATTQTYLLTASDVGHTITVQETASNAAWGSGAPKASFTTDVVQAAAEVPIATSPTPPVTQPPVDTPTPNTPAVVLPIAPVSDGIVRAGKASFATGMLSLALSCQGTATARCNVAASLSVVELRRGSKVVGVASRLTRKTVVVGHRSTALVGGQHATLRVRLSAVGVGLLKRAGKLPLLIRLRQQTAKGSADSKQRLVIRASSTSAKR
jgi:hypothetical protein